MDSGGEDGVLGNIGRVLGQEEGANLVFCAKLRIDVGCIADSFLDLMFLSVATFSKAATRWGEGEYLITIVPVLANQFLVIPFKYNQAGERVARWYVGLGKLHQDKGVDAPSPSFAAVHP